MFRTALRRRVKYHEFMLLFYSSADQTMKHAILCQMAVDPQTADAKHASFHSLGHGG